jgi:hypothetical protein
MPRAHQLTVRQGFTAMIAKWHELIERARDPYRPELHYMRGPGPKWHGKHHSLSKVSSPASSRLRAR